MSGYTVTLSDTEYDALLSDKTRLELHNAELESVLRKWIDRHDKTSALSVESQALVAKMPAEPTNPGELGKCSVCSASYYRVEDIGTRCEVQYCRGTVRATGAGTGAGHE